jgi:hypothetical protein
MRIINILCFLFYLLCLLLYLFYSLIFTGESNHSSFNIILDFVFCFIIAITFSIILRKLLKNKKDRRINLLHFIVLGLFFVL